MRKMDNMVPQGFFLYEWQYPTVHIFFFCVSFSPAQEWKRVAETWLHVSTLKLRALKFHTKGSLGSVFSNYCPLRPQIPSVCWTLFKILPGSSLRQGRKLLHSLLLLFMLRKQLILAAVTCWLKQVKTEWGFRILIADRFIMVCEAWCLPGWPCCSSKVWNQRVYCSWYAISQPQNDSFLNGGMGKTQVGRIHGTLKVGGTGPSIDRKKILGDDTWDITREGWTILQGTP